MHLKHKMAMAAAAALAMAASSAAHAAPGTGTVPGHHASQGLIASPGSGYCDPFADWDDVDPDGSGGTNGGDDSTTNDLLPGQRGGRMEASAAAAQVIGTTPDAIHRNFTGVITRNLANAGTASRIARLSDHELRAVATYANLGAPADRAALLKLLATRLDATGLVRVARAFGRAPVTAAVHAYAGRATREAYDTGVAGLSAPPPEGGGGGGTPYPSPSPPRPTIDMTLREIYLEYRTAPVGSLSPQASLAETSMFAGRYLGASFTAGAFVGTVMRQLILEFAPGINDAIGDTIGAMIENFWLATDEAEQGHFEAAFDDLFGFPVTRSSDPDGDWSITAPMLFYYQTSQTCGW